MASDRPAAPPAAPPSGVAERLQLLRSLARVESDVEARARLAREQPVALARPFAELASGRLRELRALCELARHLHRAGSGLPRAT